MSRSDGSNSDQSWVPQWYLTYPPRSYDEHISTPDDSDPPSGNFATGEPVWMEHRPFLDLVPPPNTPVRSSFDDEDYSPAPCNFDFGGTENSHLFDYTENEVMEDEDDEDMPDSFRPLLETAEIATLFDDNDIDDEIELEWEIYSCSNPQASMGDLPSEYDEPHPESP
ncbi:hypothetical protein HG530_009466 [Fusarium avenaceum]|nr:hypothetical protein HG530_009466 [Fusarium avenaceum]